MLSNFGDPFGAVPKRLASASQVVGLSPNRDRFYELRMIVSDLVACSRENYLSK